MKYDDDTYALAFFIGFALLLGGAVFILVAEQLADPEGWEHTYLMAIGLAGTLTGLVTMAITVAHKTWIRK